MPEEDRDTYLPQQPLESSAGGVADGQAPQPGWTSVGDAYTPGPALEAGNDALPDAESEMPAPGSVPLGSPFAPEPGAETAYAGGPAEDEPVSSGPSAAVQGAAADLPRPGPAVPPPPPPGPAPLAPSNVSDDDRLMAALAWLSMVILQVPIVSIVLLLADGNKNRPFQRYHATTSLLFWVAAAGYEILAAIAFTILTIITLGCLAVCLWVIFFVPHVIALWYTIQAYQGRSVEIPVISRFVREQGWAQ